MKSKTLLIIGIVLVIGVLSFNLYYFFMDDKSEEFQLGSVLIKTVLKDGDVYGSNFRVANINKAAHSFSFTPENLEGFFDGVSESFILEKDETREIYFNLSNKNNSKEGIYLGSFIIDEGNNIKNIPVVIELESKDVLYDSNINLFPTKNIEPGDSLSIEAKIYDLSSKNENTKSLSIVYFIKDFEGDVIIEGSENFNLNGKQDVFSKSFNLDKEVKSGNYIFGIIISSGESVGTSSYFFRVDKDTKSFYLENNTLVLIIFVFIIFILLGILLYSMYSRDRLLEELKDTYSRELKKQDKALDEKERKISSKLSCRAERKTSRKLFKKIRDERKNEIRRIHRLRLKQIKQIKRNRKNNWQNQIKSQINKWKKQGYDTNVLESKYKAPTLNDIKNQVNAWKKQGYDTKVLKM